MCTVWKLQKFSLTFFAKITWNQSIQSIPHISLCKPFHETFYRWEKNLHFSTLCCSAQSFANILWMCGQPFWICIVKIFIIVKGVPKKNGIPFSKAITIDGSIFLSPVLKKGTTSYRIYQLSEMLVLQMSPISHFSEKYLCCMHSVEI